MDFSQACTILERWVRTSGGNPIELSDGRALSFARKRTYSDEEVGEFESQLAGPLPNDYRSFMRTIGAGEYFIDQYGLGVVFHPFEAIPVYQREVFAGRKNPFPTLLLIVSLTNRGDEGGVVLFRSDAANFAVFSHEDDPERWLDSPYNYVDFGEWLVSLVSSEGEDDLP